MPQQYVEPSFTSEVNRLQFLSRLWRTPVTAADVIAWNEFLATKPVVGSPDWRPRMSEWREARVARQSHFILSKWDSYRLGKVRPAVEVFLSTRPNPNRAQAREAVRLQLIDKFSSQTAGTDIANELLPLVNGLVW